MIKERVAKGALESMALAELRKRRGCEVISAIEIEYVPLGISGNWRIRTVDFGDATVIQHPAEALSFVTKKLQQRYSLLPDS